MACAHLRLEQYEEAENLGRKAMLERPEYIDARLVFAAALGFLGRSDESRAVFVDEDPAEIVDLVGRRIRWGQLMKDKLLEGLRLAGLADTL